jgi:hypothetical protein
VCRISGGSARNQRISTTARTAIDTAHSPRRRVIDVFAASLIAIEQERLPIEDQRSFAHPPGCAETRRCRAAAELATGEARLASMDRKLTLLTSLLGSTYQALVMALRRVFDMKAYRVI